MTKMLAYFFYLIFFPIIFVYKTLKIKHFNSNLQREINKANYMHKITGKNYYVIQSGYNLTVGSRKQLREKNKRINKKLKLPQRFEGRFGKRLNFDYRNAIIYTADGRDTEKQ